MREAVEESVLGQRRRGGGSQRDLAEGVGGGTGLRLERGRVDGEVSPREDELAHLARVRARARARAGVGARVRARVRARARARARVRVRVRVRARAKARVRARAKARVRVRVHPVAAWVHRLPQAGFLGLQARVARVAGSRG